MKKPSPHSVSSLSMVHMIVSEKDRHFRKTAERRSRAALRDAQEDAALKAHKTALRERMRKLHGKA